jgi:hypothetical protein
LEAATLFWTELALHEQKRIVAGLESKREKSPSIAEAEAKTPVAIGKGTVDDKGVITIPSAACSSPVETRPEPCTVSELTFAMISPYGKKLRIPFIDLLNSRFSIELNPVSMPHQLSEPMVRSFENLIESMGSLARMAGLSRAHFQREFVIQCELPHYGILACTGE